MTRRRRGLLVTCSAGLVLLGASFLMLPQRNSLPPQFSFSFTGYTNLPNTTRNYAVFTLANHDEATLQVRGAAVEMEGEENRRAPIFHRNFMPGFPILLKYGDSRIIMLGDPDDPAHPGRMRMNLEVARFGLKQKLFAFGPRYPFISLRPSGKLNELRLYLWKCGLPFLIRGPQIYSAQSEWLASPYVPEPQAKAQL